MKSICKRGHPLEGDNLYTSPKGSTQCKACLRIRHAAYRQTEKGKFSAKSRDIRQAGWTLERYETVQRAQNHRCAICQRPFDEDEKRPACDHDHESQQPRGLLCNDCNSGIGFLKDSPLVLEAAIRYLNQWKGNDNVRS